MKFRIFIFALIINPFFLQAQKEQTSYSTQEIDALLDSTYRAYRNVDFDETFRLAQKSLQASKVAKYDKGLVFSYLYLAQNYSSIGKYKDSQNYLIEAEKVNSRLKSKYIEYEIHRLRGRNYGDLKLYNKSIAEFKTNLALIPQVNRTPEEKEYLRALTHENLYVSFDILENIDSAFYYMDLNRKILKKLPPELAYTSQITLYTYLGKYFNQKNNYDSAVSYFQKSEKLAKEFDFPYTSFNDENWGDFLWKVNKPDEALEKYLKAVDVYVAMKNYNFLSDLYSKISEIYFNKGDIENGKIYKEKATNLTNTINDEKFKALDSELVHLEEEKEKSQYILRIVQYIVFGILIVVLSYVLYFYLRIKPSLKRKNIEIKELKESQQEIMEDIMGFDRFKDFEELSQLAKENSPEFLAKFQDVYPNVVKKLLEIQPKLQNSELTFCGFLYLNFSTKDIANITSTSPRTVQTRKYNLRKKLSIPTEDDLYVWFRNLD